MTRSEWIRRTVAAYWDEPCEVCGHPANNFSVDEEGNVEQYCEVCRRARVIAQEPMPATFDDTPALSGDLPF